MRQRSSLLRRCTQEGLVHVSAPTLGRRGLRFFWHRLNRGLETRVRFRPKGQGIFDRVFTGTPGIGLILVLVRRPTGRSAN